MVLLGYFVAITIRDSLIFCFNISSSSITSFWSALKQHFCCLPVDFIIFFVLCVHGNHILDQDEALICEADAKCQKFIASYRVSVIAGFAYILFNCSIKFLMLVLFMTCFGGLEMLIEDTYEQKLNELRQERASALQKSLLTDTF